MKQFTFKEYLLIIAALGIAAVAILCYYEIIIFKTL